jgi:hypothetical protein
MRRYHPVYIMRSSDLALAMATNTDSCKGAVPQPLDNYCAVYVYGQVCCYSGGSLKHHYGPQTKSTVVSVHTWVYGIRKGGRPAANEGIRIGRRDLCSVLSAIMDQVRVD